MQVFKAGTGRRVSKDPEKVFTNDFLLSKALKHMVKANPSMKTFAELSCDPGMRTFEGRHIKVSPPP